MPSIKFRQALRANQFISTSGQYRDLVIDFEQVFQSASAIANMSGSILVNQPSASGPVLLQFSGTSSGCAVTLQKPIPTDIAIAAPAAGSGLIIFDWLNKLGTGNAVIAASFGYLPAGSGFLTGVCALMTATCTALTPGCALGLNSTSLAQFNFPTTRNGTFVLRFAVAGQDAGHTAGSEFELSSIRIRYLSDRMGI